MSLFIHLYLFGCNYFWMLCEGIYLHTLIVVAVFAEKQHLMWYYLLGWGKSIVNPAVKSFPIQLVFRSPKKISLGQYRDFECIV